MRFLFIFFNLLLTVFSVTAAADTDGNHVVPSADMQYYFDAESKIGVDRALELLHQGKFKKFQEEPAFAAAGHGSYWVIFRLPNDQLYRAPQTLEAIDSHIDHLHAYFYRDGQLYDQGVSGYWYPFERKPSYHKNFIYSVTPEMVRGNLNKKGLYFIAEVSSSKYSPLIFKLRNTEFQIAYSTNEYFFLGLFYGLMMLMLIFNFFFYLSVKDRLHLVMMIYILGSITLTLYEDSLGFQYLWPEHPWVNQFLDHFSMPIYLATLMVYIVTYLNIRKKIYKYGIAVAYGLFLLCWFNFSIVAKVTSIAPYLYMLPTTLLYFLAIRRTSIYKKGSVLFLIGFTITYLGLLPKMGIFSQDDFRVVYFFNVGLVLQALFYSMALVQNFKDLKKDKEHAQKETISSLKDREEIISQKVIERTAEVEEQKNIVEGQKEELGRAYEELSQQAEKIKKMNEILNRQNQNLVGDLSNIKKARVMNKKLSFEEFRTMFPTDLSCFQYLADLKWSEGSYRCRKCGSTQHAEGKQPFSHRCSKCGYDESPTFGTIFHRLHISIIKAFYLVFLVYSHKGKVTSIQLSSWVDLPKNTCWRFSKKIIKQMESLDGNQIDGWDDLLLVNENEAVDNNE
ncbi:7TM diverse intracellular signaling domain-containing protein [Persicobacter psychrovividus]|uniref:7TMR-DISM extracellular 2 n=1 Tax=Persicobacter psychrovividus TaxID=387638 RepID=A0ABN6LGK1_9BACT|nr:hypothetical protein PEPS_45190 [Persicobacter psychrovividus]